MEIRSDVFFFLSEDLKIQKKYIKQKKKTDGSGKEKRLCMCRMSQLVKC